ncbi:MAG TPA: SDR family oxidoreductase [Chromatiales bacterium]|nr:SDR family oxidoreductase [Thiotrichales bacterium]HIP69666.1 SDR family oxidoreductase [Chromatiales bacterium]
MTIKDKVIVLTGAGSGLGRALAEGFAKHGAIVVGFGRREAALKETAAEIANDNFHWRIVDVSQADVVADAIQSIQEEFGRIDALINNAAIYPKVSFLDQSPQEWMEAMNINVGGVASCCHAVLPIMMQQGHGRIINLGSFADKAPIPLSSGYSASKGAVRALTKAIAADLGDQYPDIILIEWIPGHLNTQMSDYTGIDPKSCIDWAIDLINLPENDPSPRIFVENEEWFPPKGLRERLKEKLFFFRKE